MDEENTGGVTPRASTPEKDIIVCNELEEIINHRPAFVVPPVNNQHQLAPIGRGAPNYQNKGDQKQNNYQGQNPRRDNYNNRGANNYQQQDRGRGYNRGNNQNNYRGQNRR